MKVKHIKIEFKDRIDRFKLKYYGWFNDKAGTRAKLRAHAIVDQMIDYCESTLNKGKERSMPLLKRLNLKDLAEAYTKAQKIVVQFDGDGNGSAILRIWFLRWERQLLEITIFILPWGHIIRTCEIPKIS